MRSLVFGQWAWGGNSQLKIWWMCAGLMTLLCLSAVGRVSAETAPSALALDKAFADLKDGDWILKSAAMSQLAQWKIADAEKPLREVLAGKEHPWLRGRGLVALAQIKGGTLLRDAIEFFDARHPVQIRTAAIESLGIIGDGAGEATIQAALKDQDVSVRRAAILALARLKGKSAWDTVSAAMANEDNEIVLAAVKGLQYIDTPEARKALLDLLKHKQWEVRFEAAKTIQISQFAEAIQQLFEGLSKDHDHRVRKACEQALVEFKPDDVAVPVIEKLVEEDTSYYSPGIKLLQLRPSTKGCDALAKVLMKQDERYRNQLTQGFDVLADFNPDAYHGVFIKYFSHSDRGIRQHAVSSLGKCKTTDIYTPLGPLLNGTDQHIRHHTVNVLRNAKGPIPEAGIALFVAPLLTSQDGHIRNYSLELLRRYLKADEFDAALEALAFMLNSPDKNLQDTARKILLPISDDTGRTRMAKAQGILADWMLLGSFPTPQQTEGTKEEAQPKTEIDQADLPTPATINFKQEYKDADAEAEGNIKWRPHTITNEEFRVPLHELYFPPSTENKTAFAVADFQSEADESARLSVYADDSHTLWLNGKQISEQTAAGEYAVDAAIVKGGNRIFVRILNVKEWWLLTVKVTSKSGQVIESITQKSLQ
ncbi:MAG: HEAT repeat domain-containing protein [Planctomycetota bacterium]|nr:HEAT repeat domain-containing protein [Planctomycetota bacterium]